MSLKSAKNGIIISIVCILILTVLELPAPIGIETRPQNDVSLFWLLLFLVILISEFAAALLIFKKPKIGANLAIIAGVLNIFQIIADQLHLMQLEIAPFVYTLLEYSVCFFALVLIYFVRKARNSI
ncbi:MAG TPA: hypothetical protein VFW58_08990 [Trichococcus sp.]|nr:hypothetical protein [Trichococcus sp.]